MAKCSFKLPDELLLKISKLGDKTDEIIPEILKAGADVVCNKVKDNLKSVIGKETKSDTRSTGELLSALGVSSAKQDNDGNYNIKIGFSEHRKDGKNNALIASTLEYGKSGQPPKPFLKPAKSKSKAACIKAMEQKYEELTKF